MFEVVITLGILSVVSIASVWLIFTTLNLRDQALATTQTNESLRVFMKTLRQATMGATVVTGSATTLFLTAPSECWSFVYDAAAKSVRYAQSLTSGCTPDLNPATSFFSSVTQVPALTFMVIPLATGGRQVVVTGVVNTILPFENYQADFTNTFTNVVD